METTEFLKQRKAVDLPVEAVRSLAMAAAAKGISLKKYMENICFLYKNKIFRMLYSMII